MPEAWWLALIGGVLIGIAASLLLYWNGRIAGVSGILGQALTLREGRGWRLSFLAGLIFGGFILLAVKPAVFEGALPTPMWTVIVAGLLVGFGTSLGSGCTSGHGVCGISRLSPRSLLATITFILAGVLSVIAFRALGVFA